MANSHTENIQTIGVVGAGTMGGGIAHVLVRSGYSVILNDVAQQYLERAADGISKGLGRDVEKGRMTAEEREAALGRLKTTTDLGALAAADFIIEAVIETF